ncbi:MAG: DUF5995 family protein, partial [Acidimicrobiales bacterium]
MPAATPEIDAVLAELAVVVDEARAARSRTGYFAALYQQVTVAVKAGVEEGLFDDGPRMSRFDARFARRYLGAAAAWKAGRPLARCWKVAFTAAARSDRLILQHLLLGINAHINLDLAIAAAEVSPGRAIAGLEADFNRINDVLAALS